MVYFSLQQRMAQLGISADADERDIRRAYAAKLKQLDPETDPAGFQELHEIYQALLEWSRERTNVESSLFVQTPDQDIGGPGSAHTHYPSHEVSETENVADEPQVEANAAVLQAMTDAENLFCEVAPQFESHFSESRQQILSKARKALQSALQHPALVSIDAKDYFEWCVARHLAQGWRPGNEAMFEAAIAEFNWAEEPKRLKYFSHVGGVIDAAIRERFAFNQQHPHERNSQLGILRRLRSNEKPSHRLLIQQLKRAELIAVRFPNLLALASNEQNLALWRRANMDVPRWRRMITLTPSVETGLSQEKRKVGWRPWLLFFILILSIVRCASNPTTKSPSQDFTPDNLLLRPAVVSVPWTDEVMRKFSGSATLAGCNEAYHLGLSHQLDSIFPQLGSTYDSFVSKCAIAKLWPNTPQSAGIAKPALDRYIATLKTDAAKALTKQGAVDSMPRDKSGLGDSMKSGEQPVPAYSILQSDEVLIIDHTQPGRHDLNEVDSTLPKVEVSPELSKPFYRESPSGLGLIPPS